MGRGDSSGLRVPCCFLLLLQMAGRRTGRRKVFTSPRSGPCGWKETLISCSFPSLLVRTSGHQGQGQCKLPHLLGRGPALLSPPGPLGFWWLFISTLLWDLLPINCSSSKEYLIRCVNVGFQTNTYDLLPSYLSIYILFTLEVIYLHSS